jgi:hypothetical protein
MGDQRIKAKACQSMDQTKPKTASKSEINCLEKEPTGTEILIYRIHCICTLAWWLTLVIPELERLRQ